MANVLLPAAKGIKPGDFSGSPEQSGDSVRPALSERLEGRVDGAGLAAVRIIVALLVLVSAASFVWNGGIADQILAAELRFTYPFTEFVRPMRGLLPYAFFFSLIGMAVAVIAGWRTSVTTKLMAAGVIYWFLLDATAYSDHAWLVCVMALLVAWLPVNRWLSSDRWLGREPQNSVPLWTLAVVRGQLVLIYAFQGLARLNSDWLSASPIAEWIDVAPQGPLVALVAGRLGLLQTLALTDALFLIVIGPLLWWPRSRWPAWLAVMAYHLADFLWFGTGVSPLAQAALSLAFWPPQWPRAVFDRVASVISRLPGTGSLWQGLCTLGILVDRSVSWFDDTPVFGRQPRPHADGMPRPTAPEFSNVVKTCIAMWIVLQLAIPARGVLCGSNLNWTECGTRFAWRGQIREKQARVLLQIEQPSRQLRWPIAPSSEFPVPLGILFRDGDLERLHLNEGALRDLAQATEATLPLRIKSLGIEVAEADRIIRGYEQLTRLELAARELEAIELNPDLLRQYSRQAAELLRTLLNEPVSVHAHVEYSLNFRPFRLCIDDRSDLSAIASVVDLGPVLLPLKEPLPDYATRIALAQELQAEREYEEAVEMTSGAKRPPEPAKVPPLTPEDEAWFTQQMQKPGRTTTGYRPQ